MKIFIFITLYILLFFAPKNTQAQSDWEIEVGAAIVRFPETNAKFIGEKTLFQVPRFSVTKKINNKLSFNTAISFNSIEITEIAENNTNYFSIDTFLRYYLMQESRFINPYAFAGASLVSVQIKFIPALNLGIGNTFWLSKSIGLNAQVMYKYGEKKNSHYQFTGGLVYNLDSSRKSSWNSKN